MSITVKRSPGRLGRLDLVWTASLQSASPVVHSIDGPPRRESRGYIEECEVGLHPDEGDILQVETTPCGRITYGVVIDPTVPPGQYLGRYKDSHMVGVTMRTVFADAIKARRCRRCWPENRSGR